jgi:hypothetical protein
MGIFNWFRSSTLKRATLSGAQIHADEVPPRAHQTLIHQLAVEYLNAVSPQTAKRRDEMESYFDAHPLLGLEVTDEALVLLKINPGKYPNFKLSLIAVPSRYRRYNDEVTRLRGGKPRMTTTPTMVNRRSRTEMPCDVCDRSVGERAAYFSSDDVRGFADNGFVPPDLADVMKQKGWTREQAISAWKSGAVAGANGPWRMCRACAKRARSHARR